MVHYARSCPVARGPGSDVAVTALRQALFDYLACDRVAAAWAMKRPAKDKDLARKQQAEWRWLR